MQENAVFVGFFYFCLNRFLTNYGLGRAISDFFAI